MNPQIPDDCHCERSAAISKTLVFEKMLDIEYDANRVEIAALRSQ